MPNSHKNSEKREATYWKENLGSFTSYRQVVGREQARHVKPYFPLGPVLKDKNTVEMYREGSQSSEM